ncbi:MAG: hypothetical protein M0C28_39750 [Candidatus Moduliflexus flocculans]|nr:hypothetical protein [Candidatus Moduliflexus flocculans]
MLKNLRGAAQSLEKNIELTSQDISKLSKEQLKDKLINLFNCKEANKHDKDGVNNLIKILPVKETKELLQENLENLLGALDAKEIKAISDNISHQKRSEFLLSLLSAEQKQDKNIKIKAKEYLSEAMANTAPPLLWKLRG